MKFCSQCGNGIQAGQKVCTQCGARLLNEEKAENGYTNNIVSNEEKVQKEIQSIEKTEQPERVQARTKKPGSKKKKAGIVAVVAGVALVAGSYQVIASQFGPEKTVEGLFDAVSEGDKEQLATYLIRADGEEIDDHQLEWVMETLQDPFLYGEVKEEMTQAAFHYRENGGAAESEPGFSTGVPLNLEQTKKAFGLFDDYAAVLHPMEMEIGLKHEGATWALNGETVPSQEIKFGVYSLGLHYPGTYELSADIEMIFGSHEVNETVVHDGRWIEIPLYTESLGIVSHIEGAELYVNEESTGVVLEHGLSSFDQLLYDDGLSLYAVVDTPFGELTSESVSPRASEIELHFPVGEGLVKDILDLLFADLDEGRFLEQYSDLSGINEVPTDVSVMADQAYLQEGKHDRFWQITVPYRETWQANGDAGGEESIRDYDLVLMMPGNQSEWQVQDLWLTDEPRHGNWVTRSYDEESQFAYLEALQPEEDGKASYRADEIGYLDELFNNFHSDNVNAINGGNKNHAVRMIHESAGNYAKSVTDYIDYLRGRNITQEFKGSKVIDVREEGSEDVYIVTTEDRYIIHHNEDGRSREAMFETEYKVILTEEGYFVLELVSTDEKWNESL